MSCYECKWGPTYCDRYQTDGCWPGTSLLCFESKEDNIQYYWNDQWYHDYLRSKVVLDDTIESYSKELKDYTEDDENKST